MRILDDNEQKICDPIFDVCRLFISSRRAFSTKRPRTVKAVIRYRNSLVMLFQNGRWTVDSDTDTFYVVPRDYQEMKRRGRKTYSHGGWASAKDVNDYLDGLVTIGLVREEDAEKYAAWRRDVLHAEYAAEELIELTKKVEDLGGVVLLEKPKTKGKRARQL